MNGESKEGKSNRTNHNDSVPRSKSIATVMVAVIFLMLAATIVVLGALGISFLRKSMNKNIATYEETMNDGYNLEIKSEIQSAIAIIQTYYDRSQAGELTEEEAKELFADCDEYEVRILVDMLRSIKDILRRNKELQNRFMD